ncbi:protein lplB [Spirochaetia bacterium]|nr:protein lplB [Spirochaetia bacterium]
MLGLLIAFQDYSPKIGQNFYITILKGEWVGLKHFIFFFTNVNALRALRNTVLISLYKLFIGFPAPIILALLLNELKNMHLKKIVQTISYLPHFMSWVILAGIMRVLFSPDYGVVIPLFNRLHFGTVNLLGDSRFFRGMLVLSDIWQNVGWDSVIYLAALSSLDMVLYEAARIDGANRLQQFWSITLPGISSTIIIMFILRIGLIMNAGFDQVFNLANVAVNDVGDIIDTFVYRAGLQQAQFSYSTAIGFFKSLVGFILVLITNRTVKAMGYDSVL